MKKSNITEDESRRLIRSRSPASASTDSHCVELDNIRICQDAGIELNVIDSDSSIIVPDVEPACEMTIEGESTILAELTFDKNTGMQIGCENFVPEPSLPGPSTQNQESYPEQFLSTCSLPTSAIKFSKKQHTPHDKIKTKPQKLTGFIDNISTNEINELNKAMAQFFFGCNIPLSVADSDHFKHFLSSVRPAYGPKLPSRKVLSTTLLDSAYQQCIQEAKQNISNHSVLLIDGWKNTSNNSKLVVSMLHNAKGTRCFLDAWDLTGDYETGEKLASIVQQSIDLSKKMYNTQVYAVVSDNASAMMKMGRSVEVWHSTCSSHTANLLAKDVLDGNLRQKVVSILKEFKNPDFEKVLVDSGGSRIKLPVDTRWCSYRDSFKCLIDNLKHMKTSIINHVIMKKLKQQIKFLIFDDEFIEEVKENISLLDPICSLINRAQSTDCSIAEATQLWLKLKLPNRFPHVFQNLEHRKTMALNIFALTAFFIHPQYNKEEKDLLSSSQMESIQDFLLETLDKSGIEDLHYFNEKESIFKILYDKGVLDPIIFWNTAKMKHKTLSELALKLLHIPASSAQIERVFSNWSYVHSPIRNRLTFDRSKQLLHVYYSLKLRDKNKSDEY